MVMDGIQSWSSFEQRAGASSEPSGPKTVDGTEGRIDALSFSASSPELAPAAAAQLRLAGMTARIQHTTRISGEADDDKFRLQNNDEELELRFHWMRPHPSLAFTLEAQLAARGADGGLAGVKSEGRGGTDQQIRANNSEKQNEKLAADASKFMEAYWFSQIDRRPYDRLAGEGRGIGDHGDREGNGKSLEGSDVEDIRDNPRAGKIIEPPCNLPLELPKLRINLTSFVEPPLMSSWLPGEDTRISYESDEEMGSYMENVKRESSHLH
ncbi:hypothetical protein ACHAWF_002620 [Thalassiosira exigua]